MKNKAPFLVIKYFSKPAPGQKTSEKDWKSKAKWEVTEVAEFHDNIKTKTLESAHVILNLLTAKFVKNRWVNANEEQVLKHYMEKYKDKISQAIAVWMMKNGIKNGLLDKDGKPLQDALGQPMQNSETTEAPVEIKTDEGKVDE